MHHYLTSLEGREKVIKLAAACFAAEKKFLLEMPII
jgi:hypothetical protein